jgi:cholesterol transport system auxiliary component
MKARRAAPIAATACLALTASCALLSKSEPILPRYFSPEAITTGHPQPGAPGELELRLGRVNAAAYVKAEMVRRDSAVEISYYEERLWTEKPEVYVRRALTRALFDPRGVREVVAGPAATLDVDVVAFEEVVHPAHVGRVSLAYTVSDERVVLLSERVTIDRPVRQARGAASADAIVEALAEALSAAVDAVAAATTSELRAEALAREPAAP